MVGLGEGEGFGVGDGLGFGLVLGDADGVTRGDGETLGLAIGETLGVGDARALCSSPIPPRPIQRPIKKITPIMGIAQSALFFQIGGFPDPDEEIVSSISS